MPVILPFVEVVLLIVLLVSFETIFPEMFTVPVPLDCMPTRYCAFVVELELELVMMLLAVVVLPIVLLLMVVVPTVFVLMIP